MNLKRTVIALACYWLIQTIKADARAKAKKESKNV